MGFVKTPKELEELRRSSFDFYDAEFLAVFWETKPEIVKHLLPPPLKPVKHPVVQAIIANYPKTNFGVIYKEAALFLFGEYDGVIGIYCLAMPVDNDMALIGGREVFGYPKKMSNIHFKRENKEFEGWVERHGIQFFELKAKLNNKPNAKDAMKILLDLGLDPNKPGSITYNYKYFMSPLFKGFDYNPRLVREEITMQTSEFIMGEAEVKLTESEYDPWSEVEVDRVLGSIYVKCNSQMQPGEIVAEIEQDKFEPYSFMKLDPY
ncbi:MAG: acetoacetate decarboxylase family protein [Candidatus Lokiarchaeota archaeon]|nr:acetoacetate decarboxylase family protein [Candidatus Lokiarchaeota archaeon]